jgi:hypothetical protein
VEVLPEFAAGHRHFRVSIRGGDHARVDLGDPVASVQTPPRPDSSLRAPGPVLDEGPIGGPAAIVSLSPAQQAVPARQQGSVGPSRTDRCSGPDWCA